MVAAFFIVAGVATFLIAFVAVIVARVVLDRRRRAQDPDAFPQGALLLKTETLSSISLWHSLLARFDFVKTMRARIHEADMKWTVGRLTLAMLLGGAIGLALLINVSWVPTWAAILAGGLAGMLPYLRVLRLRTKRFRKFQEQFPEALDFMARSLAAGHPFSVALEMLANDNVQPISAEMRRTADERKLGMSWENAFRNLTERVPLVEVSLFAAAVQMQSRTGGKLNDVLARLADSMRESVAFQGEVRSLAAHGKLTGAVLTVLPLFITAMMLVVNPGYFLVLLNHPHGKDLIAAAVVCLVLAHVAIRRIVDIKI